MELNRFLKGALLGTLLQMLVPSISVAQQVSPQAIRQMTEGLEAYYQAHPEMRPEARQAADAAAAAKAQANGYCARPVYPKDALRAEQQGRVVLEFLIDTDGSVADTRIKKTSGYPLLDSAAIEGLSKCRFAPHMIDGKPSLAWMNVVYSFSLE